MDKQEETERKNPIANNEKTAILFQAKIFSRIARQKS